MAHEDSPQGHRQPPTPAELRAWRRWQHMDGARALIVHDTHGALALRPDEETQDHSRITTASAQRQTLDAGEWVRRQMIDNAESMQRLTLNHAERMQQTADRTLDTAERMTNTAEMTARTNLLLAMETLAVALSLAASAWLLIDGGQRLGMAYGIAAYQAWSGVAHGIPKDKD
jgi:hypothetical protein